MIQLDRILAQAIVDRSMKIIDCNVNVMDAKGRIIATGDPERLDTLHEGAMLVLSKQAAVEIDEGMADHLAGVRPGVNLPLRVDGRIVGCVGLTGAPGGLRQYGELVRMAAETMLEQAQLMQLLAQGARLREELVLCLVRGDPLPPVLTDGVARLGIDLALPRLAMVVEVDSAGRNVEFVLGEMTRLQELLATPERGNLVAASSVNELIVLKPALDAKGRFDPENLRRRMRLLSSRMKESSPLPMRLALGHYFPGREGLARSYRVAKTTLAIGRKRRPKDELLLYADMRLPVLLDELRQGWQGRELEDLLRPLTEQDRQGQLQKTLSTWFNCGMQKAKTARTLRIHRNTLDYRMAQIEKLTGMTLSDSDDCVSLYLALRILEAG